MSDSHLGMLTLAIHRFENAAPRLEDWGRRLASVLLSGGRLLACGNGGSAEQAQHLTAELVGRYREERPAFSALPLHTDICALTAIGNDYGIDQIFARQVRAHGRPGDVLICLSTSGSSPNVIAAAEAAAEIGMTTWSLTGRGPNPLARACSDAVLVDAPQTATVQEVHLAAIHILCAAVDAAVKHAGPAGHASAAEVVEVPGGRAAGAAGSVGIVRAAGTRIAAATDEVGA
jgi:D-sedoheptulose 7-phosphate isomerase